MQIYAQQRQNENWIFGKNQWVFNGSGANGFSAVAANNTTGLSRFGNVISESSTASVSNPDTGELLFYTDGLKVFDRNGNIMSNGDHLFGTPTSGSMLQRFYNISNLCGEPMGAQTVLISPYPGASEKFIIIYTALGTYKGYCNDPIGSSNLSEYFNMGLRYSIVDMDLNNGLGEVVSKNNILSDNGAFGITLVPNFDDSKYWLVTNSDTLPNTTSEFSVFEINTNGINPNAVHSPNDHSYSFIKISPDNSKLVTLGRFDVYGHPYYLYDFDNTTGLISNSFKMSSIATSGAALYDTPAKVKSSAEFSSDSNIVYFIGSAALLNGGTPARP